MSVAAVVVFASPDQTGRSSAAGSRVASSTANRESIIARAAIAAGYDEVVGVISDRRQASVFPDEVTVLLDESEAGEAGALHAALDWCARTGHEAVVVGLLSPVRGDDLLLDSSAWAALLPDGRLPIAVATSSGHRGSLIRLDASVWSLVPLEGGVYAMLAAKAELVGEVAVETAPSGDRPAAPVVDSSADRSGEWASPEDVEAVESLLGRRAGGRFSVVVRGRNGDPVVIRNAPFLDDATPMPTRYWLVGKRERELVGRLESAGGVDRAEAEIDETELAAAHLRYAAERDSAIPDNHEGPRPSGGVGGTRTGVKCLHAHLAWYLAGGSDPVGRWVALQLRGELEGPVAAIDCGTNSTRLLIADRNGSTVVRLMTVTRLGAGVDEQRLLAPDAIERTCVVLQRYREVMDANAVVNLRATATSAARDATNADDFFDAAEVILGVRPELLAGEEEGSLSYKGATAGLDAGSGPFLVCDLGGGSTELVAGPPDLGGAVAVRSVNIGCVRITERFLSSDPPSAEEIGAARAFVRSQISAALEEVPALGAPKSLVGVAGTISTLTGLKLGLVEYDRDALHHQRLTQSDVAALLGQLASTPLARRRALPGIEPGRADVIVGGAIVLAEVMDVFGHESLVYSEDDILDGLIASIRPSTRAS